MRYDTVCHHASLLDMQLPSAYAPLSSMYEAEKATAIEDQLVAALITDTNKERRPMGLKVGVSKMGKRQLIVSGIEHFDLGSATSRLRSVLVAEGRLDMLHTLVFNLLYQENSCTMHLYVSQVSTLNDKGDALVDLLLQHHWSRAVWATSACSSFPLCRMVVAIKLDTDATATTTKLQELHDAGVHPEPFQHRSKRLQLHRSQGVQTAHRRRKRPCCQTQREAGERTGALLSYQS